MAFTVDNFQDFLRLLGEHPEWREELRRQLFTEELLRLPARFDSEMRRVDERFRGVDERFDRVDERFDRLETSVGELRREVGQLSSVVGGTVEVDAQDLVRWLAKRKSWRLLDEPRALSVDGEGEIDVAAPLDIDGRRLWLLMEAKVRLRAEDVGAWGRRFTRPAFREALERSGATGPYLLYCYGLVLYRGVEESGRDAGIGVLSHRDEHVAPVEQA